MGYAIARVGRRRGADVTLVTGPVALAAPPGVRVVPVTSAREMQKAAEEAFATATVLVSAAAVADYRPRRALAQKLKKAAATLALDLDRNPDILRDLAARKGRRLVVGFAAETRDLGAEARRKLREKRCDLIVANDVTAPGAGFGTDTNRVRLIDTQGLDEELPVLPKEDVADRILDWVAARLRPDTVKRQRRLESTNVLRLPKRARKS
jgi:phosphopantothenoylcysteine decarboxylase/phosphopantothenate--cysteine ligase